MTNALNPKSLALSLGTVWALGIMLLALISMLTGTYGNMIISMISTIYKGYDNTIPGIVMGGIWGFIDGAIGGWLLAFFYNKFLSH